MSAARTSLIAATSAVILLLAGCGSGTEQKSEGAGITAECPPVDTADAEMITRERADILIGSTEAEAESCASRLGWGFRVGARDGENFMVTADYSPQRITVSIANDLVTSVNVG